MARRSRAPKALRDVSGITLCRNPLHAARRYNVGTDRFSTPEITRPAVSTTGPGPREHRRTQRRRHVLRALLHGSFRPRRRGPRRADESGVSAVDWHHPQWLAIGILIVVFSCTDALLTLALLERGAYEANPMMAPLVGGSAVAFAVVKIALTAGGGVALAQLGRPPALRRVRGGVVPYPVLAIYV